MSCVSEFTPRFRQRGFRMTPQRMAILHVLRHAGGHLSPTQIYRLSIKEFPGLTEPTIYRTLEFLVRNGFALASYTTTGKIFYELVGRHHHHLVCRNCGGLVEVPGSLPARLYHQLEASTGYRLDSNHMTLFGLCPQCQSVERN